MSRPAIRRTAILSFLLALGVVITLAITTGNKAHASTTTATYTSLHDTRSGTTSVTRHHLKWYVLHWAETQYGKPYAWGGTGPGSYDCSGLVMTAWDKYGKRLPRTTGEMLASGMIYRIPASKRAPGDLVFWGNYHVEFVTSHNSFGAHESGTYVSWARLWGAPTFWRMR
jgi:cell wall-associated NlpC family hydrolase